MVAWEWMPSQAFIESGLTAREEYTGHTFVSRTLPGGERLAQLVEQSRCISPSSIVWISVDTRNAVDSHKLISFRSITDQ
jgi:hypothetical protein